jgi:hypothetical protein
MMHNKKLRELTLKETEFVSGGEGAAMTTQYSASGSGQVVPGQGNGLDTTVVNPAGHAPAGQQ